MLIFGHAINKTDAIKILPEIDCMHVRGFISGVNAFIRSTRRSLLHSHNHRRTMDALFDEVHHCPEDDPFAAHQDEYEMLPSMAVPQIDRDAFQELWQENLPMVSVLQRSIEAGKDFFHVKTGCAEEVARVC